jgi:hypothetical protein
VRPHVRRVVGGRTKEREAASTSEMSRFETEIVTPRKNLESLMEVPGESIDRVRQRRSEPGNRGCKGQNVKKSPRARRGGAQRVIIATLRAWIGFRLNPKGKYRMEGDVSYGNRLYGGP